MSVSHHAIAPTNRRSPVFLSTHWSVVLEARDDETGQRARNELCHAYWYPIYAYVRRRGYQAADAEDLTQAFFTRLIENWSIDSADPLKGKFRFFLLGAMKHFMANAWKHGQRQKRGGGAVIFSLDDMAAEKTFLSDLRAEWHGNRPGLGYL